MRWVLSEALKQWWGVTINNIRQWQVSSFSFTFFDCSLLLFVDFLFSFCPCLSIWITLFYICLSTVSDYLLSALPDQGDKLGDDEIDTFQTGVFQLNDLLFHYCFKRHVRGEQACPVARHHGSDTVWAMVRKKGTVVEKWKATVEGVVSKSEKKERVWRRKRKMTIDEYEKKKKTVS